MRPVKFLFLVLALLLVPMVGAQTPTPVPTIPATLPETLTNSWFAVGPQGVLVGGTWDIHSNQRRALYWDFATETWTEIPTTESTDFSRGSWSDVAGGFIILTTYSEHTDARLIDLESGEIADTEWPKVIDNGHQGFATGDLPGYFLGGFETPSVPVVYCDYFNFEALQWETLPDLLEGRFNGAALIASDGTLYFGGGRNASGVTDVTIWALAPEATDWLFYRDMVIPREYFQLWEAPDGEIFASGGMYIGGSANLPTPLPNIMLATTESCLNGSFLPEVFEKPRQEFLAKVTENAATIFLGYTPDGIAETVEELTLPLDKGQRWIPEKDTSPYEIEQWAKSCNGWTTTLVWSEPVTNAGANTLPNGNLGFAGGKTATGSSNEFKEYIPNAPTPTPSPIETPTTGPAAIGMLLLVIGGLLSLAGVRRRN